VDPDLSLTPWQKIVQRRTFTQQAIKFLAAQKSLDNCSLLWKQLYTTDVQDGFPRELLTELIEEQIKLYKNLIPAKAFEYMRIDEAVPLEEMLDFAQAFVNQLTGGVAWKIELSKTKRVFTVNRFTSTILIPSKSLPGKEFVAVLFHEIIVHVLRYIQHQIVLPDYRMFEEGLAQSFQMYILGSDYIEYGRNKVRDFLLLLWELGLSEDDLHNVFDALTTQGYLINSKSNWDVAFFGSLHSKKAMTKIQAKYKLYCLGVHRFGRYLKRYNSKSYITADIARRISKILLQAKFDPMNANHLQHMAKIGLLKITEEEIVYFLKGKHFAKKDI
jgi:hypothetical protein